jgi:quercetin dioxygenase-like cupin family protein
METSKREAMPERDIIEILDGLSIEIVVSSRASNYTCCVFVETTPPGGGPPTHKHDREEEIFTVLEGEYEFFADGVWTPMEIGRSILSLRGTYHAFRNVGPTPARMMLMTNNGGIVVSLEYRLHPLTTVLSGMLLYPLDQAGSVLRQFNEFIATAPDELTIQSGFLQTPDGTTVLFLSPTYCGPLEAGEQVLAPLRTFGKLLVDQVQPVTCDALIHAIDAFAPKGRHYYIQTRSLSSLQPETIEALIGQGLPFSSPFSLISIHHFHGAASRVGVTETAFALRQEHLLVDAIAAWEPQSPDEAQRHLQWAQNLSQALAPYAFKGGYINAMDEQERVPLAFGSNYERLLDLKRKYDPDDVFRSTIGHLAL